ncbi:hypothetical protein GF337_14385, partial [candidate division KSB1 bacterium]|nr:hypothetical protein [candidate division KSB1 bacterium]
MYRIKVTIFLLLISLISVEIALSENYYVDTRLATASDDNSGLSPDQAWKTITKSFSVVQPGDSVLIANGTYRERMAFGSVSGTEDAPIVYKALGDSVVVTAATPIDNTKFEKVEGYENVYSIVNWDRIGNGEYRHMGVVETNHDTWDKQYERVTDPDNHSDWFFEHCPYYNWETSIGGVEKYEGSYFQYDSLVYIHPYRHLDPRTANLGIEFIRDQGELVYFTANND